LFHDIRFAQVCNGAGWRTATSSVARGSHIGKQTLLSFGPYPTISLKKARELRDQAKGQILDGADPSLVKRKAALSARFGAENSLLQMLRNISISCERKARRSRRLLNWNG